MEHGIVGLGVQVMRGRPLRAVMAGLAALVLVVGPASATTTVSLTMTERGPYACVGPCAAATFFSVSGIAHSDGFGTMTYVGQGTVLDYDPASNCLDQSETWAYTVQNGHGGKDTLWISTTADTLCFTADPNVSYESAAFTVTGGTGRFAGATGSGTFAITVLTHPQVGSGTVTATVNL